MQLMDLLGVPVPPTHQAADLMIDGTLLGAVCASVRRQYSLRNGTVGLLAAWLRYSTQAQISYADHPHLAYAKGRTPPLPSLTQSTESVLG